MANEMSESNYVNARKSGASAPENTPPVHEQWQGSPSSPNPSKPVDTRKPLPSAQKQDEPEPTMAKGGMVKLNFSQFKKVGGDEHTTILKHKDGHEIRIAHNALKPDEKKQVMALKHYAEGGEVDSEQPDQSGGASESWDAPASQDVPQNVQLQDAQQPMQMPPQMSAAPIQQAAAEEEQGVKQQAAAEGQLGNKEADLAGQQANAQAKMAQLYQDNFQKINQERQNIMSDIANKHIDPSRYMKNLSTGSQVGTAIGLILGGIGGGGTHNLVMDALQKNIDRDVEAQKADIGQKENLLHATMRQFGNLHDATSMMRVITTDAYANKIAQAAAQSKDPMAQARAQQAIGALHMQIAPMLQQIAQRQTILQGMEEGHIPPEMAVQYRVPALHQKAVFDEIERAQDTRKMGGSILDSFEAAAKDARPMSGGALKNVLPGVTSANVLALHQAMQPTFKDLEGTVRQAAMENTFNNITPKLGDSDKTIEIKRQALQSYLQSKASAPTAKGFGIDLNRFSSTKAIQNTAKPNPNQTYRK